MNQETLEFALGAMFIALSCASLDKDQRAFAIDTLHCCADLPSAPRLAPEILVASPVSHPKMPTSRVSLMHHPPMHGLPSRRASISSRSFRAGITQLDFSTMALSA